MNTKFILHGGMTRRQNDSNAAFFREFLKSIPDGGNILLVFFAAEDEETEEYFKNFVTKFEEYAEGREFKFTVASKAEFEEQVKNADGVYLHGGHTPRLLETLKQYPNLKRLLAGKVVAGSSAGAYVFATYGTAHSTERMREGLGMLPLRIICHYESEELPPSEASLREIENTAPKLELIKLKDCEWVTKEVDLQTNE